MVTRSINDLVEAYAGAPNSVTSAELASILSDETGTGAAVFANTPTFVTPVLGAATGTSLVVSGAIKSTTANNLFSSDNSAGITTTVTTASLVGKTITIKDGLITGFA